MRMRRLMQLGALRYEDSSKFVCVTLPSPDGLGDMQVLVPMPVFLKNANAMTPDAAREMYTLAASVKALVAVVCWDKWMQTQERWRPEDFGTNTFFDLCGVLIIDTPRLLAPFLDACLRQPPPLVVGQGLRRKMDGIDMGCCITVGNRDNVPLQASITVQPRQIVVTGDSDKADSRNFSHHTRVAPHGTIAYSHALVAVICTPDGTPIFNMDIDATRDVGLCTSNLPPSKASFQRKVASAIDDDDDAEQSAALDSVA